MTNQTSTVVNQETLPEAKQNAPTSNPKVKAAKLSVLSNSFLVIMKLVVGIMMGSVSVISEAIHSALDLLAALIALFSVKTSSIPADEKHPFGHGKVENVSGVIEALLIFIAAIWIIVEAVKKLRYGAHVEAIGLGVLVMGLASLVNLLISRYLFKVAKEHDSIALKADALHLSTDVITSVGVMLGLALIKLTGLQILDPLVALAVACLIIKAAYDLTKEAFWPLLDTRLPEEEEEAIINIIKRYEENYVEFHKLRSRKAGSERHIDLHLVVPENRHVIDIHHICDCIEHEINESFPATQVLIHVEPCNKYCPDCSSQSNCTSQSRVVRAN